MKYKKINFFNHLEAKYSNLIVPDTGPLPLTFTLISRKNLMFRLVRFRNHFAEFIFLGLKTSLKVSWLIYCYLDNRIPIGIMKDRFQREFTKIKFSTLKDEEVIRLCYLLSLYGLNSFSIEIRKMIFLNFKNSGYYMYGSDKVGRRNRESILFCKIDPEQLDLILPDEPLSINFYNDVILNNKKNFNKRILTHQTSNGLLEAKTMLTGKRVAIVGPGQSTKMQGFEIDQFDTIIRFNASELPALKRKYIGSRTDISFENYTTERTVEKYFSKSISHSKLIWSQLKVEFPIKFPTLFQEDFTNLLWLNGSPFGVLRALLEVLPFEPSKIKVFNSDFGLNSKTYDSSYDNSFAPTGLPWALWYWAGVGGHDFLINFVALKHMFKSGYFEADETLRQILEMEISDFANRLDALFYEKIEKSELFNSI